MKKTTLWKIASMVLLVAVTLPLFSAMAPTPVSAVAVIPPLPYAMEQYGQHHSGIYSTEKEVKIDGEAEEGYILMDFFDDQAGNYDGVFVSETEDGSVPSIPATEYVPDGFEIAGTYDGTYLYLLIKTLSRTTDGGYSVTADFGFNFGLTQKNAQESKKTVVMEIPSDKAEVSDENVFVSTETLKETTTDSSGTYSLNATVYECKVAWSDIAPEGQTPEESFDRFYLTLRFRYFDGSNPMYWIYGVPNDVMLPSEVSVKEAFQAHFGESAVGTFTPNVVELLGKRGAYTQVPEIAEVDRVDENTNNARSFEVTGSVSDVTRESITEAGILFMEKTSDLGANSLTLNTSGAQILTASELVGESKLNFTVSFSTKEENYNAYFTLRPYVKYADGSVVYGKSYSNTPSYFDAEDTEYDEYLCHLMIGNSFVTYFLDEMVQIAKADNIHLTVVRSYKSGASSYENWTFLVNEFSSDAHSVLTRKVCSPELPNTQNRGNFTLQEILAYADWTSISSHDRSDGTLTDSKYGAINIGATWEESLQGIMYLQPLFRYLKVNYPDAKLFFKEPWAYQLGYGYEKGTVVVENGEIVAGTPKADHPEALRMDSLEKQAKMQEAISTACAKYAEISGLPMIPCGTAWSAARENPVIGDILCNKGSATDYYHEGDVGGGQYLNAAIYYEMITGNDVRGNTWRPSYAISEEQVLELQKIAHEAVLNLYGPDHYSK
ncbi:MAG: DUF4886 domain-containing protein [Clostridia bacterium]|nr:DUF4886 domain-containing protein [Clostridia bacterium]